MKYPVYVHTIDKLKIDSGFCFLEKSLSGVFSRIKLLKKGYRNIYIFLLKKNLFSSTSLVQSNI